MTAVDLCLSGTIIKNLLTYFNKMTSTWRHSAGGHVPWGRSASQSTASNASAVLTGRKKSSKYLICLWSIPQECVPIQQNGLVVSSGTLTLNLNSVTQSLYTTTNFTIITELSQTNFQWVYEFDNNANKVQVTQQLNSSEN